MEELRDFRNESQSMHDKKTRENERMREKEMERGRRKERKIFHKNNRYWFISVLDIVG